MNKKQAQKDLEELRMLNEVMKSAASMVGFDVDAETKKAEESLDRRVSLNLYQKHRMRFLEMIIND